MVWEISIEVLDKHEFTLFFLVIEIGKKSCAGRLEYVKNLKSKCNKCFEFSHFPLFQWDLSWLVFSCLESGSFC